MDSGKKIPCGMRFDNAHWSQRLRKCRMRFLSSSEIVMNVLCKKKMKWHDHGCLHLCVEQAQICTDVNKQKYTYVQIDMNDLILRNHLHVFFSFFFSIHLIFFPPDNFSVVHSTLSRTYKLFENNAEMWYTCDSCIRFERFFFWFGFPFIGFSYVHVGFCGRIYRHFTMVNAVL